MASALGPDFEAEGELKRYIKSLVTGKFTASVKGFSEQKEARVMEVAKKYV